MKFIGKISLFIFVVLLISVSCTNDKKLSDEEIYSFLEICLEDYYQNYDIELLEALNQFEQHLIQSGKLRDSSGKSYKELLIHLDEYGYFQGDLSFSKFNNVILFQNPSDIISCGIQIFSLDSTEIVNTHFGEISHEIQKTLEKTENMSINFFFRIYYRSLDEEEFELPYIKPTIQLLLYRWYYQSANHVEN